MKVFRIALAAGCVLALSTACVQAVPSPTSAESPSAEVPSAQATPLAAPEDPVVCATSSPVRRIPASIPNLISPEVHPDRTITFRLFSPDAVEVTASGDFGGVSLSRGADDLWSATTQPLEPAVYIYHFTVDGVQQADPNNPEKKGSSESLVTVPGDPPGPWEVRAVPHGTVAQILYFSPAFQEHRRFFVYTPPGYEGRTDSLPVLYLLHGYSDDDSAWTVVGKANLIADSLLADGVIEPMLLVMPYGQFDPRVAMLHSLDADFQALYAQQLLTEIIPFMEREYRVAPDAKHRALAGLSMGGFQAAIIGLNRPETFGIVGMWSSAFFGDPAALLGDLAAAPEDLKHSFLYVHVGVGDQDSLLSGSIAIDRFLTDQMIDHEWTLTPGEGHTWVLWRRYLAEFLPRISSAFAR